MDNNNNSNKICNPETQINKTKEMNDRDYLNIILEIEKNMSNNLSVALNEASNEQIYNSFKEMFEKVKTNAREAYTLMFQNGWYTLEKAETTKINETSNNLNTKFEEFNN